MILQVGGVLCASGAPYFLTAITREGEEPRQPLQGLHSGSECELQIRNCFLLPAMAGHDLFRGEVVDFLRNTLFLLHRKPAPPRAERVWNCHCNAHLQVFCNTTILFCMCVWHCLFFVCFTFELYNS